MVAVTQRELDSIKSFEDVSRSARPYPAYLLPEDGSALALFAAGFYGWNDSIHFTRKNMALTCVDTDKDRLWAMAELYPPAEFHVQDAWEFAEEAEESGRRWDVVSVDPYLGDAADRAHDSLYMWTSLADRLVTLTVSVRTQLNVPVGWEAHYFPRSDKAAWMVLERA